MKILYIDPIFGISGDMMIAALLDCGVKIDILEDGFGLLEIGKIKIVSRKVKRCGIKATFVEFKGGKKIGFEKFGKIIENSEANKKVKTTAIKILKQIERTERSIHGKHSELHELNALDTLIDAYGFAFAVDYLQIDRIFCGPVGLGQGLVKTAHGAMPAFTYFASKILKNFSIVHHKFSGELVTPTGASVIVSSAKPFPAGLTYKFKTHGLGAGKMNFRDHPNILRIFIGTTDDFAFDKVSVLQTNIDDAKPLIYQKLFEEVRKKGGLDIYLAPYYGRNSRIGIEVTVISKPEDRDQVAMTILRHTSTLGVRVSDVSRYTLKRHIRRINTSFGTVRVKFADIGGKTRFSVEYRDLKKIADRRGMSISEIEKKIDLEINRIYDGIV